MPIYEFYCARCHTVFSFLSRSVQADKVPPCPRDGRHRLERQVSGFAVVRGGGTQAEEGGDDLPADEARLERAMAGLAAEAEGLDEDDPRAAARLMRRLSQRAGLRYGEGMEEALRRLEAGEDPEAIEAEMGDALEGEGEEPFLEPEAGSGGAKVARRKPPRRDETLYEM